MCSICSEYINGPSGECLCDDDDEDEEEEGSPSAEEVDPPQPAEEEGNVNVVVGLSDETGGEEPQTKRQKRMSGENDD
jgi:hypothetical protein